MKEQAALIRGHPGECVSNHRLLPDVRRAIVRTISVDHRSNTTTDNNTETVAHIRGDSTTEDKTQMPTSAEIVSANTAKVCVLRGTCSVIIVIDEATSQELAVRATIMVQFNTHSNSSSSSIIITSGAGLLKV
jgi:hypothetical protein